MVFGLRDSKISQRVHLHHQLFFLKHFCFILNVGRCNIMNFRDKPHLVFDKRGDDGKRLNLKMVLPQNYALEEQLDIFQKKIREKY